MGQLLFNVSIEISHKNIIAFIQRPDIFISIFCPVGYRRAGITSEMCGCINNMLAILCKKRAGRSSFTTAYLLVFEFIAGFLWYFAHKYPVAFNSFFWIGALKNDILAVKTPVGFCIVATE